MWKSVLVRALVLTDLAGTCLTSPVVLAAYGRGRTLLALGPDGRLCRYFAFAMSFFGLATVGCLGAMALERSLALGAPYLYRRLRRPAAAAALALPALYALAAAVCALPLLGFGRYVQYCPGTWCFLQTRFAAPSGESAAAFALLYAALLLLLVLAVLLGNLAAIVSLLRMHRRGPRRAPPDALGPPPPRTPDAARRPVSMAQELDHLILLAFMTIIFAVCSLPFTIRVFLNRFTGDGDYKEDLRALRFLSINSIIDPWVFTILRPPVLRLIRSVLCCRMPRKPRNHSRERAAVAKAKPSPQVDICKEDTWGWAEKGNGTSIPARNGREAQDEPLCKASARGSTVAVGVSGRVEWPPAKIHRMYAGLYERGWADGEAH
ncbi:PREDICTED: prostaglandin E2 receptor EP2 subtype [Gekko japonicus]|uniref:Prostaglandin E2 receptor EP2 subtype n=1 Tax=Gekko japonicus TaxID=146911 RepID=A0ABM1KT11_GEKJA|nr:PREDICTED: prostaglandin E2 receptor EP2 subtype [Gekko japonicus]